MLTRYLVSRDKTDRRRRFGGHARTKLARSLTSTTMAARRTIILRLDVFGNTSYSRVRREGSYCLSERQMYPANRIMDTSQTRTLWGRLRYEVAGEQRTEIRPMTYNLRRASHIYHPASLIRNRDFMCCIYHSQRRCPFDVRTGHRDPSSSARERNQSLFHKYVLYGCTHTLRLYPHLRSLQRVQR